MSKTCLIITSKDDTHADFIIKKVTDNNINLNLIRLNTEDWYHNTIVSFVNNRFAIEIIDSGKRFTSDQIFSVWFRRPKPIEVNVFENDNLNSFVQNQSNTLLRGLYFSTHDTAKWINPLPSLHRAKVKIQQLVLASKVGFKFPDTLITNNPKEVINFTKKYSLISNKSLDEPYYQDGIVFNPLFNRIVDHEFIVRNVDSVINCPTLFQQYIDKVSDLRVVVIENKVFAFEIDSQANELSRIDFRGTSFRNLTHKVTDLPDEIVNKIYAFMKLQNLKYSSMDFVRDRDGNLIFIENNPNGQFLWLEFVTGFPISNHLIEALNSG